jgi:hypothetical protein
MYKVWEREITRGGSEKNLIHFAGMNELLGPIYYTFATDQDLNFRGSFSLLASSLLF